MKKLGRNTMLVAGGLFLAANSAWAAVARAGQGSIAETGHPAASPKMEMQRGVDLSSEKVMALEQKLQMIGLNPGNIDGVIDSETQSAIAEFQMEKNLPVTGTLDEQTLQELTVAMDSRSSEPAASGERSDLDPDISS
jgi:peptidoglycan hydrolase-like protein with peptidoglycan-binding domain